MRIVLLGAPGSGKRTQTQRMVEKYGLPAICTGELLKDAVVRGDDLGIQVKAALDAAQAVSEEVVLELIERRLLQADAQQGFILDGFPRNILQAITLDELLIEIGQPLELALLIDIETDALMERLVGRRTCRSCGTQYNIFSNPTAVDGVCDLCGGHLRHRADDNEGTISSRLHIYDHLASPLLKHYDKQGKLKRVEGFGEIAEVFSRICRVIDAHQPPAVQKRTPGLSEVAAVGNPDLQLVPEENPVKQLIPTGLELPDEPSGPATQASAPVTGATAQRTRRKTSKKGAVKKSKIALIKQPSLANKASVKKQVGVKQAGTSTGASTRGKKPIRKSAVTKQATAKQKSASKQAPLRTGAKESPVKKSAAAKKPGSEPKKAIAAGEKRPVKKKPAGKPSLARKKSINKTSAKRKS